MEIELQKLNKILWITNGDFGLNFKQSFNFTFKLINY